MYHFMPHLNHDESDVKDSSSARAHAARVGWQHSARAAKLRKRPLILDKTVSERLQDSQLQDETRSGSGVIATLAMRKTVPPAPEIVVLPSAPSTSISRFGAVSLPGIDAAARFLGTAIWPSVGGSSAASHWFQDFCTSELLFHAQSTASAVYEDLMVGRQAVSLTRRYHSHKLDAIRHIKYYWSRYNSLSAAQRERLIFAILILGSHEVKPKDFFGNESSFRAYVPTASLLHIWGRTDPIAAHDNAAFALVELHGGLDHLQMPGLAPMVAFVDLLRASTYLRPPKFACWWKSYSLDTIHAHPNSRDAPTYRSRGSGFLLLSHVLPVEATTVFVEAARLDQLFVYLKGAEVDGLLFGKLLSLRNAIIHRLCSLESEPAGFAEPTDDHLLYTAVRLACTIYCNAVIFAIPPHNGWLEAQSAELREILGSAPVKESKGPQWDAYMWTLCIGSVASRGTSYYSFFEETIKTCARSWQRPWVTVEGILESFIWSSATCGTETKSLWS